MDDITEFERRYATFGHPALFRAELDALGSDYGANGYTTKGQADAIGAQLNLGPGQLLLDVGAGCGWPGLYLATKAGSSVVSLDPVADGMAVARRRAHADGLAGRSAAVVADAADIPLRDRSVDAIVHTDVMC